jgi:uncharacterized protein
MFRPLFFALRAEGVPVSPREWLMLLHALDAGLATNDATGFYHLARAALVKDERHLDRFDRAFAEVFRGVEALTPEALFHALELPPDWLRRLSDRQFTEAERAAIEALGGFDALMESLRQRLADQQGRHQGGSKWIGTGGTSPFGAGGYNPEGVRIGQDTGRQGRAVQVWDRRAFRDLDDQVEIGTRALKVALRRLRRWAREGAAEELDLDGTIGATARQGWLDVRTRPERQNAARVILFLDVGGSMDPHVRQVEELFSAARSEFRHLDVWYFHNCLYDFVWAENARRWTARTPTADLMRRLGGDWNAIFVGDAAMSPYELTHAGGAAEHWNDRPGLDWLAAAAAHWPRHLWINPVAETGWRYTASTAMVARAFGNRMVPLTLDGLTAGLKLLR